MADSVTQTDSISENTLTKETIENVYGVSIDAGKNETEEKEVPTEAPQDGITEEEQVEQPVEVTEEEKFEIPPELQGKTPEQLVKHALENKKYASTKAEEARKLREELDTKEAAFNAIIAKFQQAPEEPVKEEAEELTLQRELEFRHYIKQLRAEGKKDEADEMRDNLEIVIRQQEFQEKEQRQQKSEETLRNYETDAFLSNFSSLGIFEKDQMAVIDKEVREFLRENPALFYVKGNPQEIAMMQVVSKHGFEAKAGKPVNIPPTPKTPNTVPGTVDKDKKEEIEITQAHKAVAAKYGISMEAYKKQLK